MERRRVFICGGPKTGKSRLATKLAFDMIGTPEVERPINPEVHDRSMHLMTDSGPLELIRCDDFIKMGWSESSEHVAKLMERPGPIIIEGVMIPRALRKFLKASEGKPCDELIVMTFPKAERTAEHLNMTKGHDTVLKEIMDELVSRGVKVTIEGS